MRVRRLWAMLIMLSAVACSGSSTSPTVIEARGDVSWTEDGQSFRATLAAREAWGFFGKDDDGNSYSAWYVRGEVCDSGTGIEIKFQAPGANPSPGLYTVAAGDFSVGYTDGTTAGGDLHEEEYGGLRAFAGWGAGRFGGSGSVTVTEFVGGGNAVLSGTFTFELVPTSGNLGGGTKSVQGSFTRIPWSGIPHPCRTG